MSETATNNKREPSPSQSTFLSTGQVSLVNMASSSTGLYGIPVPSESKMFDFRFWSVSYLFDYLVIIIAAAICGPFWIAVQTMKMYFLYTDADVNVPFKASSVANSLVIPLVFVPVLVCLFVFQIWFRNLHDLHHAVLGFIQSITLCTILHVILWTCVGHPRPNFMHSCKPIPGEIGGRCANEKDIIDERHDFPSGHAAFLVCAGLFLLMYVIAKFETFRAAGSFHTFMLPFLLICLGIGVGGTRVAEGHHSPWAVVAGVFIGLVCALIGYHFQYPGFWKEKAGIPRLRLWTLREAWSPERYRLVTPVKGIAMPSSDKENGL